MSTDNQNYGSSFGGNTSGVTSQSDDSPVATDSSSNGSAPENSSPVDSSAQPVSDAVDEMFGEAETDSADENDESSTTENDSYEPEIPNDSSPQGGEFKWDDIRKSVEFTRVFMESSSDSRTWFRWILNLGEDTSIIYILKRLRDYDGSIWGLRYTHNLINTLSGGQSSMMETLRIGAELANLETEERRSLINSIERIANSFKLNPEADDISLRYRKNMDDSTFINMVIESIGSVNIDEANTNLGWAFDMVSLWNN